MRDAMTFLAAVMPALILVGWFQTRDGYAVSSLFVWRSFAVGVLSAFVVFAVGGLFARGPSSDIFIAAFNVAFFGAAIPEELAKMAVLVFLALGAGPTRRPYDMMVAGAAVGAGFAGIENVLYVVDDPQWEYVAMARALVSVPGHVFVGAVMGACLAQRTMGGGPAWTWAAAGLPIFLHGLYDFPLFVGMFAAMAEVEDAEAISSVGLMSAGAVILVEAAAVTLWAHTLRRQEAVEGIEDDDSGLERSLVLGGGWVVLGLVTAVGGLTVVGTYVGEEEIPAFFLLFPVLYAAASFKRGYGLLTAPG